MSKNLIQKLTSFILVALILSCSEGSDNKPLTEKLPSVEDLEKHSEEFTPKIYSYDNGIHMAVGYGIANSIMVEGETGNIIIDASDSTFEAQLVYKPVSYTHLTLPTIYSV